MNRTDPFHVDSKEGERFVELLSAKWVSQALSAAAELGVFDALDGVAADVATLASALGCQTDPLRRLLRVLCGEGLILEHPSADYELTPLGRLFLTRNQGTLARYIGSSSQWQPWAYLARSIRTGENAFELANGKPLFEYLDERPDEAELYHSAVDTFTSAQAAALSGLGLFNDVRTFVDVGGGRGTLVVELLDRQPNLRAVLFDRPEVVARSKERLRDCAVNHRIEYLGGDFFRSIPAGHDCYVIKHVLHNWSDDLALELLCSTRAALRSGGRIVVVDEVLIPGNRRDLARFMDLEMFVVTGQGRERSKPEFRRLFSRADLQLRATARLTDSTWALILEPKRGSATTT